MIHGRLLWVADPLHEHLTLTKCSALRSSGWKREWRNTRLVLVGADHICEQEVQEVRAGFAPSDADPLFISEVLIITGPINWP